LFETFPLLRRQLKRERLRDFAGNRILESKNVIRRFVVGIRPERLAVFNSETRKPKSSAAMAGSTTALNISCRAVHSAATFSAAIGSRFCPHEAQPITAITAPIF